MLSYTAMRRPASKEVLGSSSSLPLIPPTTVPGSCLRISVPPTSVVILSKGTAPTNVVGLRVWREVNAAGFDTNAVLSGVVPPKGRLGSCRFLVVDVLPERVASSARMSMKRSSIRPSKGEGRWWRSLARIPVPSTVPNKPVRIAVGSAPLVELPKGPESGLLPSGGAISRGLAPVTPPAAGCCGEPVPEEPGDPGCLGAGAAGVDRGAGVPSGERPTKGPVGELFTSRGAAKPIGKRAIKRCEERRMLTLIGVRDLMLE